MIEVNTKYLCDFCNKEKNDRDKGWIGIKFQVKGFSDEEMYPSYSILGDWGERRDFCCFEHFTEYFKKKMT